jgi:hypothetical protein
MNFKQYASLLFFFLLQLTSWSQKQLLVIDAIENDPMAFVKVFPSQGTPFFTDIDGKANLDQSVTTVRLSFVGYKDTLVALNEGLTTVYFAPLAKNLNEIVVLPGVNPALRIINKVIANRKKNHPLENDAFTYDSYNKFIFDVDTTFRKEVKKMDNSGNDSISKIVKRLESQYFFMMESASERRFIPPAKDREDIKAYKVSGTNNPLFASFAQSMQTFHFYDNQFELFGEKYFNPIALGAPNRYHYLIEDTTIVGTDTTFLISFRPKVATNSETMKGLLFINTNGFAIERVIASPAVTEKDGTEIKIVQEYKLIDGKKWFPVDLKTYIELKSFQLKFQDKNGFMIGTGSTYIKNIRLNPEDMDKRGFNNIALSTDHDAGKKSENEWENIRKGSLSEQERRTYEVVDSVSKAHNFDRKLAAILALTTGKINVSYLSFPLDRIIDYNYHEGYRLGLGIETSERVSKQFTIGGYFAYGFRDKQWKYGGYTTVHLNKRLGMSLTARFQDDVMNRGGTTFTKASWDLSSMTLINDFYQKFMDKQRLAELRYTVAPIGNLTLHLLGNYQRIQFTHDYQFIDKNGASYTKLDVAETAVEATWNIRQKMMLLGDLRVPISSNYPKIQLKIAKGWSVAPQTAGNYWRMYVGVNEELSSLRWGKLNLFLAASQTFGDVPLTFKQYGFGTRQDWHIVTDNVLETAYPGEFYHDRQASFITRYSFPIIRTKKKWLAPEFTLHHGMAVGDMKNKSQHLMQFNTMNNGFYEAGLSVGLLKINFMKVGIAAFYRYGPYSSTKAVENIVPKISIRFDGMGFLSGK